MKGLLIVCLTLFAFSSFGQSPCGFTWLKEQRNNAYSKPPWDDYVGPRVRELYHSSFFTLQSDKDYSVPLKLETGNRYTILFYTGTDALASGVELRDASGMRVEFEKVYGKSVNNWLEFTYEAGRSGAYALVARSIFPSDRSSCASVLVREYDEAAWEERLEESGEDVDATE